MGAHPMHPLDGTPAPAPPVVRIILIEDQKIFRDCLAACLDKEPGFAVIGSFSDTQGFLAALRDGEPPHVALLDIGLSEGLALGFPDRLKKLYPKIRTMWITASEEDAVLYRAFGEGLPGFVHKADSIEEIVLAIRTVARGERYYSQRIEQLWAQARQSTRHFSRLLSKRQQEVLGYFGSGFTVPEIAAFLGLSPETVKAHRRDIMARLQVHSAAELQAYAIQTGFAVVPPRLH